MKQVVFSAVVLSFLGFTVGCNGGSKPPSVNPVATPIKPDPSNLPAAPQGGGPFKK